VACVILLICCWVYFGAFFTKFDGSQTLYAQGNIIIDPDKLGLQMYFFAKGLFCSSVLLLLGEFLKKYLGKNDQQVSNKAPDATR